MKRFISKAFQETLLYKKSCLIGQLLLNLQDEMEPLKCRSVKFYRHYFEDFFVEQKQKVKDKITWTLKLIEEIKSIPEIYLKHLTGTDGLFEIRVQSGSDIFRIFCFFDEGNLIVLMNGFQKKTQKTPVEELAKAIKIKGEYYEEKKRAKRP